MRAILLCAVMGGILLAQRNAPWHYRKDDPQTGRHIVEIDAQSFETTKDPSVFLLRKMTAHIYGTDGSSDKRLTSDTALLNEKQGTLALGPDYSRVIKLNGR